MSMKPLPSSVREQVEDAYRRMAAEAKYCPEAPSDGYGHVTVDPCEQDIDAEARAYAEHWWAAEEVGRTHYTTSNSLGVCNNSTRVGAIFAFEAARQLASSEEGVPTALKLLALAAEELSGVAA
jgi:hypothetical protein